ncbi:hypothetical protein MBLNU230_g0743t1 [Neophaeotheca triangularis]
MSMTRDENLDLLHSPSPSLLPMDTSASTTPIQEKPSLLYAYLPQLVQRRVPRIPSLRHTASQYGKPSGYTHTRHLSDSSLGSITPPPSYRATTAQSPRPSSSDDDEDEGDEHFTSAASSRPSTSGTSTPFNLEQASNEFVQWKYARLGRTLLSQALLDEDLNLTTACIEHHQPFVRQLYIDSLVYLLHGLPPSLNPEEKHRLQASLPSALQPPPPPSPPLPPSALAPTPLPHHPPPTSHTHPRSLLHRTTAHLTLHILSLLSITLTTLLPYLTLALQTAQSYNRKHNLTSRLITLASGLLEAGLKRGGWGR